MFTRTRPSARLGGFLAAGLLAASFAAATPAHAAALPANLQIVEGVGIGSLLTLGQSRSSVISTLNSLDANNGNCASAMSCTFRLSPDTAAVTLSFTSAGQVGRIGVVQGGVALDKRWSTTAGVTDGMAPADVAARYPGSVVTQDVEGTHVVASKAGYTYHWRSTCYGSTCTKTTSHEVYLADGATLPGGGTVTAAAFQGAIRIYHADRRTETLTLRLTVTDPHGRVARYTDSVLAAPRSYVTVGPNDVMATDGPLGTYRFRAELLRAKRVVGAADGTIALVQS